MSTLTYAVADSAMMLRRQLRHMLRYASITLMLIGMPSSSCCCSSTSSAGRWARGWVHRPAAGRSTSPTSSPGSWCSP